MGEFEAGGSRASDFKLAHHHKRHFKRKKALPLAKQG
jgi:hypothetical protein